MPRARSKPTKKSSASNGVGPSQDVLTLPEAAAYMRVSEDELVRLVHRQNLPGRQLESGWRFLKSGLQDWLKTPPPRGSREAVLSVAGVLKDDPYLEKEVEEIYKQRGRPMTEHAG
jgi:excisionase family DNA binding protein